MECWSIGLNEVCFALPITPVLQHSITPIPRRLPCRPFATSPISLKTRETRGILPSFSRHRGAGSLAGGRYHDHRRILQPDFFQEAPALGEMHMDTGLHHIGLQVDDLEEVKGRFLRLNPRGMIIQEANDLHHGEIRLHDPECRPVTVSTKSFGVPQSKEKTFPRVRHIAYNALDPETMCSSTRRFSACAKSRRAICAASKGAAIASAPTAKPISRFILFTTASKATKRSSASTTSAFSPMKCKATMAELSSILKNCAAPLDPPLRRISLSRHRRQCAGSLANQRLGSRRR